MTLQLGILHDLLTSDAICSSKLEDFHRGFQLAIFAAKSALAAVTAFAFSAATT